MEAIKRYFKAGGILSDQDVRDLFAEVERLTADREWQIEQNVKMFKALETIAGASMSQYSTKDAMLLNLIAAAVDAIEAVSKDKAEPVRG